MGTTRESITSILATSVTDLARYSGLLPLESGVSAPSCRLSRMTRLSLLPLVAARCRAVVPPASLTASSPAHSSSCCTAPLLPAAAA